MGKENLICLRHDVDESSPGTLQLARIEYRYGVRSTYYLRLNTVDFNVIQELKRLGHEVSYHYETIAEYMRTYRIDSRAGLDLHDYVSWCTEELLKNVSKFRREFDLPCRTLAAHRAPENRLIGLSNASLFKSITNLKSILDIDVECYEDFYMAEWDAYVSDCPVEFNYGYRYGVSPESLMQKSTDKIMFLSHPNHWGFTMQKRIKRLIKVALKGVTLKDERFAYEHHLRGGDEH